jgi:hypothetical protein
MNAGKPRKPAPDERRPPDAQTQRPRPTWGEQTPDLDEQRREGGGGTSSDSDGQQQSEPAGPR